MKKIMAVLLALGSLAVVPQAQAQAPHREPPRNEWNRPQPQRPAPRPAVKIWKRGEVLRPGVGRSLDARDVRRNRLAEPRRGETWVQVGGQFLLVARNGRIVSAIGR